MAGIATQQTELARGDGAEPEVFTKIPDVTNISGPNETKDEIDVTSFDSTAREYIPGIGDSGELTFDLNFRPDDTQQQGLRADKDAGTARNYQITLTDGTTFTFEAIVTAFTLTAATNDAWRGSVTLKISGAVDWDFAV